MKFESKRMLTLLKVFAEDGIAKLQMEHDSLFDLPEDPEEKLKENNLNIAAAEQFIDAVNQELLTKH